MATFGDGCPPIPPGVPAHVNLIPDAARDAPPKTTLALSSRCLQSWSTRIDRIQTFAGRGRVQEDHADQAVAVDVTLERADAWAARVPVCRQDYRLSVLR